MTARVLIIAGSDSGGGAGVQADLKSVAANGAYGTCAITALTAQNTLGVQGVLEIDPDFVAAQIDSVMSDIGADVWKLGMLSNAAVIRAVAARARAYEVTRLVLDPVMVAKGGDPLLRDDARATLAEELLPLAFMVTPNHHEASVLAAMRIRDLEDMHEAAVRIHAAGARYVLVKGGDLPEAGERAVDVLYDGQRAEVLQAPRIHSRNTHGTGCTLAAAIAARLARGAEPLAAVQAAKRYVSRAISAGAGLGIGAGHGPLQHFPDLEPGP